MQIFLTWKNFKSSMKVRGIRKLNWEDTQICSSGDRVGAWKEARETTDIFYV